MVNKVIFTINSNFNGIAKYYIYEGFGCSGNTITYSGTTQIVNGSSNVVVSNVDVTEDLSIKIVDSGNCNGCFNKTIVIPEQPEQPIEQTTIPVEYIVQAYNEDLGTGGDNNATGYLTLNYVDISGNTLSVVTDGVTANREITDSTSLATINVKNESTVQIVASNLTPSFNENVKTIVQVYAYYPSGSIPPQAILIDSVDIKTIGSPVNTTINLIASDGFGSKIITKYRIYVTFVGFYNSLSGGPII